MRVRGVMLAGIMLLSNISLAAAGAQVGITVYNNDLALVRETRTVDLQKGIQEFKYVDVAALIDPTSVHFASLTWPEGVGLLEQNFEYDLVGTERLLEKYLDQRIVVSTQDSGTFSGKLLNAQGADAIIHLDSGPIKVIKAASLEAIEFPSLPEGLSTRPTLVWLLDCHKPGTHTTEISYLTKGVTWHAEYVGVTNDEDTLLQLNAWVSIKNRSGMTYHDAALKLVAGDVKQVQPKRPYRRMFSAEKARTSPPPKQFEEKSFFEYHLYTLQRPATLKDRQIKQIALFPPAETAVAKMYTYDGQRNGKKVLVSLEFVNDKAGGLGMPLPAGKIRIYKKDTDNSQVFVGENMIDHTPKGEKVRVSVGNAFDIVGERTVKDIEEVGRRSRRETVEIRLRNHKEKDITVTVVEHFSGDWEFVGRTPPAKKKTAYKTEFDVAVARDSEKIFEYTVLYKH